MSGQLHIYKVLVIIKQPSHLDLFEDLSGTVDLTDNKTGYNTDTVLNNIYR